MSVCVCESVCECVCVCVFVSVCVCVGGERGSLCSALSDLGTVAVWGRQDERE